MTGEVRSVAAQGGVYAFNQWSHYCRVHRVGNIAGGLFSWIELFYNQQESKKMH